MRWGSGAGAARDGACALAARGGRRVRVSARGRVQPSRSGRYPGGGRARVARSDGGVGRRRAGDPRGVRAPGAGGAREPRGARGEGEPARGASRRAVGHARRGALRPEVPPEVDGVAYRGGRRDGVRDGGRAAHAERDRPLRAGGRRVRSGVAAWATPGSVARRAGSPCRPVAPAPRSGPRSPRNEMR